MLFYVQYQIPQLVLTANSGILTLYALMDSSFWFETINLRRSIVYIKGSKVIISKQMYISLKIFYVLANDVDPDDMSHSVAFH